MAKTPNPDRSKSGSTLAVLQKHVGGCREWVEGKADYCFEPARFVLWGKLIPPEGLGPRCFSHAREHVSDWGTRSRSGYALINLTDLAEDLDTAADAADDETLESDIKPCCLKYGSETLQGLNATVRYGDERRCPGCGSTWVHVCNEAEGCCWVRA